MSTKNKDILIGKIEIDENEFASQHTKIRVTTMLDEDALIGLKKIANKKAGLLECKQRGFCRPSGESSVARPTGCNGKSSLATPLGTT